MGPRANGKLAVVCSHSVPISGRTELERSLSVLTVLSNVGAKFVPRSPGVTVPLPTQSYDPTDLTSEDHCHAIVR
jgi:hypothetical protein